MKKIYLSLTLTLFSLSLIGGEQKIVDLLPGLKTPLLIEPAIPNSFVLIEHNESSEYFWGPKGLTNIDPQTLKEPLIHVIVQSGMPKNKINEIVMSLKVQFSDGFVSTFSNWGSYPYASIKMMMGFDAQYLACVGLDDNTTLIFRLIYPTKNAFGNGNSPSIKDLAFWNNFLKNTKPI